MQLEFAKAHQKLHPGEIVGVAEHVGFVTMCSTTKFTVFAVFDM